MPCGPDAGGRACFDQVRPHEVAQILDEGAQIGAGRHPADTGAQPHSAKFLFGKVPVGRPVGRTLGASA
jgi:hypothetical protein